ncbi:MAG: AP2 domain-containing protein [Rhodothermales bacterium]|nr:AP2 domain-containing protein [Rhodothermales bacterium]
MGKHHHIVRIDIEPSEDSPKRSSTHGWQVRVSHNGRRQTKFFADRKYGGRDKALQLAIEHREVLLAARPDPSDGVVERRAQARSTSGVAGVRLAFKNDTPYVEANWVRDGKRSVSSFSVDRWGLRKATWQACKSRAVGRGVRNPERVQTMFETAFPNLQESLDKALAERTNGAEQDAENRSAGVDGVLLDGASGDGQAGAIPEERVADSEQRDAA